MADLVNGIVTETLRYKEMEEKLKWVSLCFGIYLPLGVYLIVGMISLIYGYIHITWQCSKGKCSLSSYAYSRQDKQCEWCVLKFNYVYPHGSEWINILAKFCTIIGGVLYFLGDNFGKVYERDNAGVLTLGFSVFGVLLYRIVPTALKKLERYFKDKPSGSAQKNNLKVFNLCSPNNNETHSLIVAYTYLLTIVIDFDVWLTVVLKKADQNDNMNSLCDRVDEMNVLWSLYGGMMLTFLVIEIIIMEVFIFAYFRPNSQKNPCKFNIMLPKHNGFCKGCIILWNVFLSFIVFIAVGMFLIADNKHLLDCYVIRAPKDEDESVLRLSFFVAAFVIFFMIIVGFFSRLYHSVQIKGELVSMNVLSNDKLQVYVCEKTGTHSFKYQIETSEITESDFYHEEMYINDIEHIAKCLGSVGKLNIKNMNIQEATKTSQASDHPLSYTESDIRRIVKCFGNEGKLVAVNIRDDQIAVVREVEGVLYLVLHTHEPATTDVYKVLKDSEFKNIQSDSRSEEKDIPSQSEEKDIPSQSNDKLQSELVAVYHHDQGTYDNQQPIRYIILFQNHEGMEYAVLKEKERNASPFVNEKLISWNVWTEKDIVVVLKDPDTKCVTIKYNEQEDCFEMDKKSVTSRLTCIRSHKRTYKVLTNNADVKEF